MVTSVALSGDGSRLFASYWGAGEVLVMDTAELIAAGESLAGSPAHRRAAAARPGQPDRPHHPADRRRHVGPDHPADVLGEAASSRSTRSRRRDGSQPDITFRWDVDRLLHRQPAGDEHALRERLPRGQGALPRRPLDAHGRARRQPAPHPDDGAAPTTSSSSHLPSDIKLTAGQTYYWGVIADGRRLGRAGVRVVPDRPRRLGHGTYFSASRSSRTASSSTRPRATRRSSSPQQFLDMAHMIADPAGGLVLKYDRTDGRY